VRLRVLLLANLGTACADAIASCFCDPAGIRALDCRATIATVAEESPAPATPTIQTSRRCDRPAPRQSACERNR
jgi:hypothetical protein